MKPCKLAGLLKFQFQFLQVHLHTLPSDLVTMVRNINGTVNNGVHSLTAAILSLIRTGQHFLILTRAKKGTFYTLLLSRAQNKVPHAHQLVPVVGGLYNYQILFKPPPSHFWWALSIMDSRIYVMGVWNVPSVRLLPQTNKWHKWLHSCVQTSATRL